MTRLESFSNGLVMSDCVAGLVHNELDVIVVMGGVLGRCRNEWELQGIIPLPHIVNQ